MTIDENQCCRASCGSLGSQPVAALAAVLRARHRFGAASRTTPSRPPLRSRRSGLRGWRSCCLAPALSHRRLWDHSRLSRSRTRLAGTIVEEAAKDDRRTDRHKAEKRKHPGLMLQQELPDRPCHSILIVRRSDMEGCPLYFVRRVPHGDPQAGQSEHPNVGLRIAHRDRLLGRDTELAKNDLEGAGLVRLWVREYHIMSAVVRPVDRETGSAVIVGEEPARDLLDRLLAEDKHASRRSLIDMVRLVLSYLQAAWQTLRNNPWPHLHVSRFPDRREHFPPALIAHGRYRASQILVQI